MMETQGEDREEENAGDVGECFCSILEYSMHSFAQSMHSNAQSIREYRL